MRRLSLLVVLLALPAMGQGILYRAGGGSCGVNQSCVAEDFTASTGTGPGFAVSSQLTCAVDVGPGANDCFGTNGSGYVTLPAGAVLTVGSTLLQDAQVIIVNGYLTLSNSLIRTLSGAPVPLEGGARHVAQALGTCNAGLEWATRADAASGVSTGARSRLCLCTSDGAGSPAYEWRNIGCPNTSGTTTTCPVCP